MKLKSQTARQSNLRRILPRAATLLLAVAAVAGTGCDIGAEFRAAAGPSLKSGVDSILDGVVEGLFAVLEPETPAESEAGTQ